MSAAISLLLCCAGFLALALSIERHQRDLLGRRFPRFWAQFVGWVLLAAALWQLTTSQGAGIGIATWFAVATVAALAVALVITVTRNARRR